MGGMSHMQELGIGTLSNSRGKTLQGSKQKSEVLRSAAVSLLLNSWVN